MKRLIQTIIGLFASSLLLGAVLAVLLAASTTGTRWLIDRALAASGVPVTLDGIDGTLLTGVRIARLRSEVGESIVEMRTIEIIPAWGVSLIRDTLVLKRLSVAQVSVVTGAPASRERPLAIELPALPFAVAVESLQLGRLAVSGLAQQYEPDVHGAVSFDGAQYTLRQFVVAADAFVLSGDLSVIPQPDLPISGAVHVVWHAPDLSAHVELAGALAHLRLDAQVSGLVTGSVRGHLDVLGNVDPVFNGDVAIPEWRDERVAVTDLVLAVQGTLEEFIATANATVALADAAPMRIRATVRGSLDALDVTQASVDSANGRATVVGSIVRSPQPRADLEITLTDVDPAVLRAELSGALSGSAVVQWEPSHLLVSIASLRGTLNDSPFAAHGSARLDETVWSTPGLELAAGENRAHVVMDWDGHRISGRATLELPELGALVPTIDGDLHGSIDMDGAIDDPEIHARLRTSRLGFRDWSIGEGQLALDIRAGRRGSAEVTLAKVTGMGVQLDAVRLDVRGRLTDFSTRAQWLLGEQRGDVTVSARDEAGLWRLEMAPGAALTLASETWHLDQAVAGIIGADQFSVSAHCWLRPEAAGRVCVDTLARDAAAVRLVGSLQAFTVSTVNQYVPTLPELSGTLSGRWNLVLGADGWQGGATLESEGLGVMDRGDAAEAHLIGLPQATLSIDVVNNRSKVALRAVRDDIPVLELLANVGGFAADASLDGTLALQVSDLGMLASLSRRVGAVDGSLGGQLALTGTLGAPLLTGQLRFQSGRVVLVDPHLELADVAIAIEMTSLTALAFEGSAKTAAGGRLDLAGTFVDLFDASRHLQAQFTATKLPLHVTDADAQIDAQLKLEWRAALASLKGRVDIPQALIKLTELPEGTVAVSDDVIVVDRVEQRVGATRVRVDLELVLGDDVQFSAFGLETRLDGQLRLRQSPSGLVQLNGTVTLVEGSFTAYGQTLAIQSGRLIYNGPPDNPFVDAKATRTITEAGSTVVVGAHVQGPARNIETTLFSEPQMSEAQALSYLVLGRPLAGADSEQGNDMTGAAVALGLKGAAPVIDEIRNITGIDELTATGGSTEELAVVAAKRINERLFVRYTYQTFTRTSAVLIELLLSRRLRLEATAGEYPAIDMMYRVGEYN